MGVIISLKQTGNSAREICNKLGLGESIEEVLAGEDPCHMYTVGKTNLTSLRKRVQVCITMAIHERRDGIYPVDPLSASVDNPRIQRENKNSSESLVPSLPGTTWVIELHWISRLKQINSFREAHYSSRSNKGGENVARYGDPVGQCRKPHISRRNMSK